jgi:hypothetical protein
MSSARERARVAVHEASHALVARCLGVPIEDVRLGKQPVCNLSLSTADDRARAAVVCAAGSYGERALGFTPDEDGSREDKRQCLSLAKGEAALDNAHQQARELVEQHRDHVAALACLLLLRGKLTGEEVAAVLDQPPPRRARMGLTALGAVIVHTVEPEASLAELARRIAGAHADALAAARTTVEHARRCGELLLKVKARLPHGQLMPWLKANCPFSQRTGNAYMRVARDWEKLRETLWGEETPTIAGALEALAEPSDETSPGGRPRPLRPRQRDLPAATLLDELHAGPLAIALADRRA